ncbi:uncharacterized protein LOC135335607 [Halichondria panicea]|uniref:uncharacterized protein LOC135335572 n=1 Tax=Halichondria panicea TaxID=6063 RepID=UPI00312B9120
MASSIRMLFAAAVLLFTTCKAAPIVRRQSTNESDALTNYALGLIIGTHIANASLVDRLTNHSANLSESAFGAVRIACTLHSGYKNIDALSPNDSADALIILISEKIQEDACELLKEEVGPSVFSLDCGSESVFSDLDNICALWDYSVMAQSNADNLKVVTGTRCDSDESMKIKCDEWICNHNLQDNDSIMRASLTPEECP